MKKKSLIIAGFPGVGKEYLEKREDGLKKINIKLKDFDNDPKKCIDHLEENLNKVDIIMLETDKKIREELKAREIHYILMYPRENAYFEYMNRYKKQNKDEEFIKSMTTEWGGLLADIKEEKRVFHIKLREDQFLEDFFYTEK